MEIGILKAIALSPQVAEALARDNQSKYTYMIETAKAENARYDMEKREFLWTVSRPDGRFTMSMTYSNDAAPRTEEEVLRLVMKPSYYDVEYV